MQQSNFSAFEEPNYYAIITAEIRYDKGLSSSEKLFYAEITALCQRDGRCWATRKYFANLYAVDEKTISRWTKKLYEKGYIDIRLIKNELGQILRRYIIPKSFPQGRDKNVQGGRQKCPGGRDKNVPENNIKKNNKVSKKESFDELVENFTNDEKLRKAIFDFIANRKILKKPLTNRALGLILSKLEKLSKSNPERVKILEQSIERGWAGVFPLKSDEPQRNNGFQKPVQEYKPYGMPSGFKLSEIPQ